MGQGSKCELCVVTLRPVICEGTSAQFSEVHSINKCVFCGGHYGGCTWLQGLMSLVIPANQQAKYRGR